MQHVVVVSSPAKFLIGSAHDARICSTAPARYRVLIIVSLTWSRCEDLQDFG